jgi:hypothetical protein
MTAKPTRTINRLHFSDLDPVRFEDLCLSLIYSLHPWNEVRHYGRKGSDGGVDIFAIENLEDSTQRKWLIQCKRFSKINQADLKKAVDKALKNEPDIPDVLLLIVSCDVGRKAHEAYIKHVESKGLAYAYLWSQSVIEAKLYSERPDLLFSYFGIQLASEARKREQSLKRNLALKHRIQKELLTAKVEQQDFLKLPNKHFCSSEAIIHSIDDDYYPNAPDPEEDLISGWFKLEFWDTYFNGIEFITGIRLIVERDGKWTIIPSNREDDGIETHRAWEIGRIPFRNIVDIDVGGDEFYPFPHIYCRFAEAGMPYEEFVYRLMDQTYFELDSADYRPYQEFMESA